MENRELTLEEYREFCQELMQSDLEKSEYIAKLMKMLARCLGVESFHMEQSGE